MADKPKLTKQLTLKALDGEEVNLTLKIVLSEWDWEQLDEVYFKQLEIPTKKGEKVDASKMSGLVVMEYRNKVLEVVVKKWTRKEELSPINIKKTFTRSEYAKLNIEVRKIAQKAKLSKPEKKN